MAFTNTANITGSWDAGTGTLDLDRHGHAGQLPGRLAERHLPEHQREPQHRHPHGQLHGQRRRCQLEHADPRHHDRGGERRRRSRRPSRAGPWPTRRTTGPRRSQLASPLSDVDDANLESAVIQITGNYTERPGRVGVREYGQHHGQLERGTGTLDLDRHGHAWPITRPPCGRVNYQNTSENPSTATRTVSFTVNDGDANSNTQTRDITIAAVNDAAGRGGHRGRRPWPTRKTTRRWRSPASITLSDVDDTNLDSAVVQITGNYTTGQDVLAFTNTANITGSWNAGTGTLDLDRHRHAGQLPGRLAERHLPEHQREPSTATRTVTSRSTTAMPTRTRRPGTSRSRR